MSKCCICNNEIDDIMDANNAFPLGRKNNKCCYSCNSKYVIPIRLYAAKDFKIDDTAKLVLFKYKTNTFTVKTSKNEKFSKDDIRKLLHTSSASQCLLFELTNKVYLIYKKITEPNTTNHLLNAFLKNMYKVNTTFREDALIVHEDYLE